MVTDFFVLMRSELSLTLIIFILLFIKVAYNNVNNTTLLYATNLLLLVNLFVGPLFNTEGVLFSEMFIANNVIVIEKLVLNAGTLIISLQAFDWLKNHKNLLEFYILLLSTLLGMFFMISAATLLRFYLGL